MIEQPIFVFGSNLAGHHGKGAALFAFRARGAVRGVGQGRQGASYAIPTKDGSLRTLPLNQIAGHVEAFLAYARANPALAFELTPVGCGLAGLSPQQVAPMFADAPPNVVLPAVFQEVLGHD